MNQVWTFGPFTLTFTVLALFLSAAAGIIYITYFSPYAGKETSVARDVSINALGLGLIIYIFGSVILHLPAFVSDPMAVLSYPSGIEELMLAFTFSFVFLYYQVKKKKLSGETIVGILTGFFLAAEIIFAVILPSPGRETAWIGAHPVSFYILVTGAAFLYWTYRKTTLPHLLFAIASWGASRYVIALVDRRPSFFTVPVDEVYYIIPALLAAAAMVFYRAVSAKQTAK